jgi:hypothetical protein
MSKIKSMSRVSLLRRPWLTYGQVCEEITPHVGKVAVGTIGVYGSEIRPEIGCVIRYSKNKEELHVDLAKYEAACDKYGVVGADKAELLAASTPSRKVVVISPQVVVQTGKPMTKFEENYPALHEAIHASLVGKLVGKDAAIREGLTAKLEAAELRCTEARESVKELESKLAAARKELDEAQEALTFLDSLTEAPFSVIRAVLG